MFFLMRVSKDPGDCLARTVRLQASVRDETKIAGVEFQIAVADTFAWQALGAVSVRTMDGIEETVKFPLPKGLKL